MIETIRQELAALDRFIELLQQEQAALVNADVEALTTLSQQKLKHAEELNALGRQRLSQLQQAGFSGDAAGMDAWLSGQPASTQQQWQALVDKARNAQRLNQTNGKLIQTHLQHNQQALSVLMNAANQAGVYGPDGQSRNTLPGSGRTIGKV